MRVLFITDIHGVVEHLQGVRAMVGSVDLVVAGGDLTNFGGRQAVDRVVEALATQFGRVLALPGNLDQPESCDVLLERGVSLHGRGVVVDGVGWFGVGGSNPTPMNTPFELEEEELRRLLAAGSLAVATAEVRVLVAHPPPYATKADRLCTGKSVGSLAVRELIEGGGIDLCLCGHIHEAVAVDRLGDCQICNPGAFASGGFAVVTIDEAGIRCEIGRLTLGVGKRVATSARVIGQKALGFARDRWSRSG